MNRRAVVVPSAPALLPSYPSITDPVADLRRECRAAVAWLVDGAARPSVRVVTAGLRPGDAERGLVEPAGLRVGRHLLTEAGVSRWVEDVGADTDAEASATAERLLVVANGSARRDERAPGHLDPRSHAFDAAIESALAAGDASALGKVDQTLAEGVWCFDAPALQRLGTWAPSGAEATVRYADDPFGVRYWVVTWEFRTGA